MSTLTQPGRVDPTSRRVPRLGGINPTLCGIEVRRILRNRRTVIFALLFPVGMYFIFASQNYGNEKVGSGNVAAYILVNMALYGAALTAASIGSMVAMEREVPGKTAERIWQMPIQMAWPRFICSIRSMEKRFS